MKNSPWLLGLLTSIPNTNDNEVIFLDLVVNQMALENVPPDFPIEQPPHFRIVRE